MLPIARHFFLLCLLCCLTTACSTGPDPDAQRTALALRYLRAIDAGQIGLTSITRALDDRAKHEPAMAEMTRRALANVTPNDLEQTAAPVYARHLSEAELSQLVMFVETATGRMFYRLITEDDGYDRKTPLKERLKLFKPQEISVINAFLRSESAAALTREMPAINRELDAAYGQMGAEAMRRYLQQKPPRSKTPAPETPAQPADQSKPEDKQRLHDNSWMINA